ncbi:MAG: mannonate dehydratase [Anaerolineae bacterium]|nr:mannonate dehydratase [Anaerolineae bacterium]
MKMTMRWFGESDHIPLRHIAQIPCVRGIVGTLEGLPVGEACALEQLQALKAQVESYGLSLEVIESIAVPEAVKIGLPERDALIDAYCQSIRHMGQAGIRVLCYNFMPVFDWMRTDMAFYLPDGSMVTGYQHQAMLDYDLSQGLESRVAWAKGFTGTEISEIQQQYAAIGRDTLFENLAYFLRRIVPVAEESNVYLALHPDDPPWSVFGLPRIVGTADDIQRILDMADSPHNGLTFCTGSLGTAAANDLPAMVHQFADRIHFVHLRNVKLTGERDFYEVAHPSENGSVDMRAVIRALIDIGYSGPVRPDHGRKIWDEVVPRTGYGLYDRALGAMYLYGLWQGQLET